MNRLQECRFTDGAWRLVRVTGQGRCRCGWAVLLEYESGRDHVEQWVIYDAAQFRDVPSG